MPHLASTLNRLSMVLSTSGQNLLTLEQFAPNSPFIALTALTILYTKHVDIWEGGRFYIRELNYIME